MAARSTDNAPRILNRRARYEYHILETLEAGISLVGTEVKSVRNGQVSLAEGYARVDPTDMALYLHDVNIALYSHGGPVQHEPKRRRRLLAHKRQIEKLVGLTTTPGTTLVPMAMYFVRGWAKVELAVARGKGRRDKREDIKAREAREQISRAMSRKP